MVIQSALASGCSEPIKIFHKNNILGIQVFSVGNLDKVGIPAFGLQLHKIAFFVRLFTNTNSQRQKFQVTFKESADVQKVLLFFRAYDHFPILDMNPTPEEISESTGVKFSNSQLPMDSQTNLSYDEAVNRASQVIDFNAEENFLPQNLSFDQNSFQQPTIYNRPSMHRVPTYAPVYNSPGGLSLLHKKRSSTINYGNYEKVTHSSQRFNNIPTGIPHSPRGVVLNENNEQRETTISNLNIGLERSATRTSTHLNDFSLAGSVIPSPSDSVPIQTDGEMQGLHHDGIVPHLPHSNRGNISFDSQEIMNELRRQKLEIERLKANASDSAKNKVRSNIPTGDSSSAQNKVQSLNSIVEEDTVSKIKENNFMNDSVTITTLDEFHALSDQKLASVLKTCLQDPDFQKFVCITTSVIST